MHDHPAFTIVLVGKGGGGSGDLSAFFYFYLPTLLFFLFLG